MAQQHASNKNTQTSPTAISSPTKSSETRDSLQVRFTRANAMVLSIFHKYYHGSERAVDPFVIEALLREEIHLFSLQCFIQQGPTDNWRNEKESVAVDRAARFRPRPSTRWESLFRFSCVGIFDSAGSVLRHWDSLSDKSVDGAMLEYINLVDKILPGWDHVYEFPIAMQHKTWKNDDLVEKCEDCGTVFSLRTRRHHCRMCFDVFCAECASSFLEMVLCPGAPVRSLRVCRKCFQNIQYHKGLAEVRRIMQENDDIESSIKSIEVKTNAIVRAKQREETKLRIRAQQSGCDMDEIDVQIKLRVGSPVNVNIKTPPARKFQPSESLEANDQLRAAHRQLLMTLKAAQCRAKKAVEKMDISLAVLRDAIWGGGSVWSIILPVTSKYLNFLELKRLQQTSRCLQEEIERMELLKDRVTVSDVGERLRGRVWLYFCLQDTTTRTFLCDLVEAISAQLDMDSGSGSDENETETPNSIHDELWPTLLCKESESNGQNASTWKKVYELILQQCASAGPLEHDTQIANDVQRTFGASSLRKSRRKTYSCSDASASNEPSQEIKKKTLTNVLRSFSSINTEIGYCQGMDHVAALVLSVCNWEACRAFWLLTSLMVSPCYRLDQLYCPGIPHLKMRCTQLEKLLSLRLSDLSLYLIEIEYPVSMFATEWLMTLFCNMEVLSYPVLVRVFDGFLGHGWKMFFRVCLALLHSLQDQILLTTFEEIPKLFYSLRDTMSITSNADKLLEAALRFKVTNRMLREYEEAYLATSPPAKPKKSSTASPQPSTISSPTSALAALSHTITKLLSPGRMSGSSSLYTTKTKKQTKNKSHTRSTEPIGSPKIHEDLVPINGHYYF